MRVHHLHYVTILFIVTFLLCQVFVHVLGQDEYTPEALTAMTEDELEQICITRGFQILRDEIDPTTGLPYELSHDDFVEAAQRCLDIEQEMNELLAEYPELAAEVEEEIKKLEAEQLARQAEVEALQKELEEAQNLADETDKSNPGAAFVSSSSDASTSPEVTSDGDLEESIDHGETFIEDDAGAIPAELMIEQDLVAEDTEETVAGVEANDTELIAKNETSSKDDFTMRAITFEIIREIVKQVENDIKRIVELMSPVIRPILRAGDVAWRHLKVAFESARRSYEEGSQSSAEEEGNVAQTK